MKAKNFLRLQDVHAVPGTEETGHSLESEIELAETAETLEEDLEARCSLTLHGRSWKHTFPYRICFLLSDLDATSIMLSH